MLIQKGQIVLLSAGEYSDYSILDTFEALKDFDTMDVFAIYFSIYPKQADRGEFVMDVFQRWLLEQGYIKELNSVEWHLTADYDTVEGWPPKDGQG